ncbi:hypothetical protein BKA65DRAFT_502418 [Rhexocercosporidium sp. MPI-PUGE-AT-0058]|nr:hypothetical protein BKA65DRAFT_502418 [Rhexocercosporidium sp. MPI-PUGE-AT-0058]
MRTEVFAEVNMIHTTTLQDGLSKRLTPARSSLRIRKLKELSSTSNGTFHPFPRLPLELRTKIWETANAEPRVVVVDMPKFRVWFTSPTPVPATLHACSESRIITLRTHKLCFPQRREDRPDGPATVYSNLARDTIYFRRAHNSNALAIDSFPSRISKKELEKMEAVLLAAGIHRAFNSLVLACTSLKEIQLGLEAPHLDLARSIVCSPLEEKDYGRFVKNYRAMWLGGIVDTVGLQPSAAIDRIREQHLSTVPGLEERLKLGELKLTLVKVHNS